MKMEVFSNISFFTSLNKLMNQDVIPMKVAYRLKTIKQKLQKEMANYEEMRKDLVSNYADKDDKGEILYKSLNGPASFSVENEKLFSEKFKELQGVEFDLGLSSKIKISELGNVVLNANDLLNLSDLIEE